MRGAVEKPGWNRNSSRSRSASEAASSAEMSGFDGRGADFVVVDTAAVILHFDKDVVAAVIGADSDIAVIAFALVYLSSVALKAVRNGVANEMNQRIGNLLNDVVIEFSLCAGKGEFNFLVRGFGGVTYGA